MSYVKIINKSNNPLPSKGTQDSAGYDLRANIKTPVILPPNKRELIPTGIYLDMSNTHLKYEAQIRPRSGLALKHGVTVLNSPGTIDKDYNGEVKVLLINQGDKPFIINSGDRIAQMVFSTYQDVYWEEVKEFNAKTKRGNSGFGSTGIA